MGNCFTTEQKYSMAEITPSELMIKSSPVIKLYGPPNDIVTAYMRFALHFKPVTLHFLPSEAHETPTLQLQDDVVVSDNVEAMLRFLDLKFPHPQLTRSNVSSWFERATPLVVWVVKLQHRSMTWHLERMVRWAEDLVTRGGRARGDPVMGSPRMEVRKFGMNYSQLLEVMLEHAQMEERLVFPILEMSDGGLCKAANEEHARDLPIMNGIKEDIKSVGVLDSGTASYQEALSNLSDRLRRLQAHCKEHFEEEERELLPLMEATELTSKMQQERILEKCLDVMHGTHTRLFRFFIEGLLPHEAMHYLDMIIRWSDKDRVSSMLRLIVD